MYKIIRNNKRFGNKTFPSYDDAKKYVRVWAVNNKLAPTQMHVRLSKLGFAIKHT